MKPPEDPDHRWHRPARPRPLAHTRLGEIPPYVTKDGSEIRELLHPDRHGPGRQSLAEATVRPGTATARHRHEQAEEIYHITCGQGLLTIGEHDLEVGAGDTIRIPAGTPHSIANTGTGPLKILCCCTPPYRHQDTTLL